MPGIGQVSRLTGDLARILVPAPAGKMYSTPTAADATLTETSPPKTRVATTVANRDPRGRFRTSRIRMQFIVHDDLLTV